jgi:hypothetical protein
MDRETASSKNITGFEINLMLSGHKLCSMKFEVTKPIFAELPLYCHASSSIFAVVVAGLGVNYVTSLTGYKRMSAVCVQP